MPGDDETGRGSDGTALRTHWAPGAPPPTATKILARLDATGRLCGSSWPPAGEPSQRPSPQAAARLPRMRTLGFREIF
jgi:hypothetical protein